MKQKTEKLYVDDREVYIKLPEGSVMRFIRQENPNEILIHVHVHNPSKEIQDFEGFIKKNDKAINVLFKVDMELMKEISDGLGRFFIADFIKSLPTEKDWEKLEQRL